MQKPLLDEPHGLGGTTLWDLFPGSNAPSDPFIADVKFTPDPCEVRLLPNKLSGASKVNIAFMMRGFQTSPLLDMSTDGEWICLRPKCADDMIPVLQAIKKHCLPATYRKVLALFLDWYMTDPANWAGYIDLEGDLCYYKCDLERFYISMEQITAKNMARAFTSTLNERVLRMHPDDPFVYEIELDTSYSSVTAIKMTRTLKKKPQSLCTKIMAPFTPE